MQTILRGREYDAKVCSVRISLIWPVSKDLNFHGNSLTSNILTEHTMRKLFEIKF